MKVKLITRIRYHLALWLGRRKDDLDALADWVLPDDHEIGMDDFEKGKQFDEAIQKWWWASADK